MRPVEHVAASIVTSGIFYGATGSLPGTISCLISGILIDVDHHLDLWLHEKKFLWKIKDVYHFCDEDRAGKLHLIFHSYELLALFWLILTVLRLGNFWWGIAIGATVHLILDQIFNRLKPGTYFLSYRWQNGFSKACVFPAEHYQKQKQR